jgi:hypothetical protein
MIESRVDDLTANPPSGGDKFRRILKWLTIAAWGYTLVMIAAAWILFKRGDTLGYSASAETAVLSANVALVPTCLYALVAIRQKWFPIHAQK